MTRFTTKQKGMSIIEALFYMAILVLLVSVTVATLVSLSSTYRNLRSFEAVNESAQSALERIVRELRGATSVDTMLSTLGSSPGDLYLDSLDEDGATTTLEFFVSAQTIRVKEAGADVGPLTAADVRVTNLIFRRMATTSSVAVKVEMTLESGTSTHYISKNFYSTAVLRGSYPQ